MSAIGSLKAKLRKKVLSERQLIPVGEWAKSSDRIMQHFLNSNYYNESDFLHCFVSMNERKEVNTQPLLKKMIQDEKKVVVPITQFEDLNLEHSLLRSLDDLESNKWGVPEPRTIIPADIQKLDIIIIPMAAADTKGNRLGYGKGFYDRFLAETPVAVKIGFIFSDFILDEIPIDEFDIKMDILISENGIIRMQQ